MRGSSRLDRILLHVAKELGAVKDQLGDSAKKLAEAETKLAALRADVDGGEAAKKKLE